MTRGPTSHRYISQRLQLHYAAWGNPEAPPLMLVHGGRDHCRNWDWVAEALSEDWYVIAPDLRGHGDSAWSPDGDYTLTAHVYDLAQLIHQLELAPVSLIGHSLGGNITLRYTGLYPETVRRIAAIEGLGPPPEMEAEFAAKSTRERLRDWIEQKRGSAGRTHKRYASLEEAYVRMKSENSYLSDEQAQHLTAHGISQNEDGSYSWKFDNYSRIINPVDLPREDIHGLYKAISCPTLLMYGSNSWASNPEQDGRIEYFRNARVLEYENAGHWLHHDQLDRFITDMKAFL